MIWLPRQMPSTARSCRSKSRSKIEKPREIGIVVVRQRVLAAAEHDRRVMAIGAVRQRFAEMRAANIDFCAGFGECRADLAEAGIVVVLDDEDAQRQSPDNPACQIDAARLSCGQAG